MRFPKIEHISDVLPHIAGLENIKVFWKDGYAVIDYIASNGESDFPNEYALECRGLKFDAHTGHILARPFHKFFNHDEYRIPVDFNREHEVLVKLDGSMIHPCFTANGAIRFMTRMGITDVSQRAELLFPEYLDRSRRILNRGITPIFEYIGPDNRIVLRYDRSELVLIAARETVSGRYLRTTELQGLVNELSGTLVPPHTGPIERVVDLKGVEGVVVVFADGFRTKVKARDYVLRHRAKDNLHRERIALSLVLTNQVDDISGFLDPLDSEALRNYSRDFRDYFKVLESYISRNLISWDNLTRKDVAFKIKDMPKWQQPFLFAGLSGPVTTVTLEAVFLKQCSRTSHLKEFLNRQEEYSIYDADGIYWTPPRWKDYYNHG